MSESTANDTNELIEQQNSAALLWSDLQMLRVSEPSSKGQKDPDSQPDITARAGAAVAERLFGAMVEFSRKNSWLLQSASKLDYYFKPPWIKVSSQPVVFSEEGKNTIT